jgi:hypothetical protein
MNKKNLYNKIMESISKEVKKTLNEGLPLEHHNDDYNEINYIFDLDELLDDEKTLKYYDKFSLRFLSAKVFGGPFMINEGKIELLEKTPSRTYSVEEVTKIGRPLLGLEPGWIKTVIAANKIETCVLTLDKFDNVNFIIEGMKAFGWSFSYDETSIIDRRIFKSLHFDPMFQNIVNEEIKNCSLLHHWTPLYNFNSIMQNGLIPKSNNFIFSYPPKIHLIKGTANNYEIMNIGEQLCLANKDSRNDKNYVLLNINAKDLLDKIDFFYDPRYEWGYYTKQPIDKQYISKNKDYKF